MFNLKLVLLAILLMIGCVFSLVPQGEANKVETKATSYERARSVEACSSTPSTSAPVTVGLCDIVPTSQEPIKILVPLYVYPGAAWDAVASAASQVGVVAIVNPNSGPLASGPDSPYTTYMTKLANSGVEMVGYVYTSWGARSIAAVKADIDLYASRYSGINGIFFDEGSALAQDVPFYTQLYDYVKSKGMYHVILNPGVQPDQGYLPISTNIVIFENYGTEASRTAYPSWVKCAPNEAAKAGYKYKFSGIAHTISSASQSSILSTFASQGMGLVYVTDGAGGCCTYNTLTSYFAAQASAVAALN